MNTPMEIMQSFLKVLTRNKYITQCDSTMIGINKMSLLEKYIQDQLTSSGSCVRITEKIKEGKYTEIQILCRIWSGKLVKNNKGKEKNTCKFSGIEAGLIWARK